MDRVEFFPHPGHRPSYRAPDRIGWGGGGGGGRGPKAANVTVVRVFDI